MIKNDFSEKGLLASIIPNYNFRKEQFELANLIKQTIDSNEILIAEAGTGTGKTFAYLIPALRSKQKVVISTGTKALQDQLFYKDIPLIYKALSLENELNSNSNKSIKKKIDFKDFQYPVILKGRSNYLCLEKLDKHISLPQIADKHFEHDLIKIKNWSLKTTTGDISQANEIPENSYIWSYLTSTHQNCLGSECPRYESCFVNKARNDALNAQLVIVNHHLFFADANLKSEGFGKLLPDADIYIFDEAHQIPDIASSYYGEQLTSKQLYDVANDLEMVYRIELTDTKQLQSSAHYLNMIIKQLRLVLGDRQKGDFTLINHHTEIKNLIKKLLDSIQFCIEVCKTIINQNKTIENCHERLLNYQQLLLRIVESNRIDHNYWFETNQAQFIFAYSPLSIAKEINKLIHQKKSSWIFTSATLTINQNFNFFNRKMGLDKANTAIFESPFNYYEQALLCVPRYLPQLNQPDTAFQLVQKLLPIIEVNQGGCFFLCTSHAILQAIANELRKKQLKRPVLVQGEMGKTQLLEAFIQSQNALLIGTNTFWEGVDLKGDLLKCVIIDKLPFQSPDDPMLKARIKHAILMGQNAFEDVQMPEAIIALKQGIGRLIRDKNDKGVIIICDNRLVMKEYAAIFLKSLPRMKRTRDLDLTINFLKSIK